MKTVFFTVLSIILLCSYNKVHNNQNRYELIVFEGSDWCSNCRKFEKNILKDSLVIYFLQQEKIQITKIDFPQRTKLNSKQIQINKQYAEKYQFEGVFPTVILSRIDSLVFKKLPELNMSPSVFIEQIKGVKNHIE